MEFSLSLGETNKTEHSRALALTNTKKILFLESSIGGNLGRDDEISILMNEFYPRITGRVGIRELEELHNAIMERAPDNLPDKLRLLYDKALKMFGTTKSGYHINLKDDEYFIPIIDPSQQRQVHYICGMSGSGKSTHAASIIKSYKHLYPKNNIYFFSNKPSDPVIDDSLVTRVPFSMKLLKNPINLEMLKNSLVIFDDVEGISQVVDDDSNSDSESVKSDMENDLDDDAVDTKIKKLTNKKKLLKLLNDELERIKDLILQQGRSFRTSFIYISHLANDYKRTRTIINECHSVTIFPQMVSSYSLKYLLEKYLGLSSDQVKKVNGIKGFATIFKAPSVVVCSKAAWLCQK